jgi:hypothetical protein
VLASPGLVEGIAAGDEIELTGEEPRFRVTRRGGNVCVQFFWSGDMSECARSMGADLAALGGRVDGETPGLLVFTIPVAAGFTAIERILYDAEKQISGLPMDLRQRLRPSRRRDAAELVARQVISCSHRSGQPKFRL